MKRHKFCQSCGMPHKKDTQGGGTEKDGSKSLIYCSFCYKDGRFNLSDEIDSAKKMQAMCIKMMKKQGMSGILAWVFTRRIPKLERWR